MALYFAKTHSFRLFFGDFAHWEGPRDVTRDRMRPLFAHTLALYSCCHCGGCVSVVFCISA